MNKYKNQEFWANVWSEISLDQKYNNNNKYLYHL